MLSRLVLFELQLQMRQIAYWGIAVLFFFMAMMIGAQGPGSEQIYLNGPEAIAFDMGMLSMFAVLAMIVFSGTSMLRDARHRMQELVLSAPISKWQLLTGRFLGTFMTGMSVMLVAMLGLIAGLFVFRVDPARVAVIEPTLYLWNLGIIAIPNLYFAAALLFSIAALTRNMLATYLGGLQVYGLYLIAGMLLNSPIMAASMPESPSGMMLSAIMDPLGLSAIAEQTYYWSIAEKNAKWISLSGNLLVNRVLWLLAGSAVLLVMMKTFAFKEVRQRAPRRNREHSPPHVKTGQMYHPIQPGDRRRLSAFWSIIRVELSSLFRNYAFAGMLIFWALIVVSECISGVATANRGGPGYPVTSLLIWLIRDPLPNIGALILIFASAELVWREREHNMHEVLDAMPVQNSLVLLSKLCTLVLIIAALILIAIFVAAGFQFFSGYSELIQPLYFSLFYTDGLPLLYAAVVALLLQTILPNKYVGMLAALVVIFGISTGALTGVGHNLLRFGRGPALAFSEMNGFGSQLMAFNWFMLYWGVAAGLLILLTNLLWRRGTDSGLKSRIAGVQGGLRKGGGVALALMILMFITTGTYIFYNTNVLNHYENRDARLDWMAEYEKHYKAYDDLPQPILHGIYQEVDLHPRQQRYAIRAKYRYQNRSGEEIDSLLFSVRGDVHVQRIAIENATLQSQDAVYQHYWYKMNSSLMPDAHFELQLDIEVARAGFANQAASPSIVENGAFIMLRDFAPWFGYRSSYEITQNFEREQRGLPRIAEVQPDAANHAVTDKRDNSWTEFEAIVSTDTDQIAIAPGDLVKQWHQQGRTFFHYRADKPIKLFFGYMSARYAVANRKHKDLDINIYYHPEHDRNLEWMFNAIAQTFDYCEQEFGPYPLSAYRVFEMNGSQYWGHFSGIGMPGMMGLLEDRGFLADISKKETEHLAWRRIAHEVAHQWWGHQLNVGEAPGGGVLVEGLTKYTEMMVMEKQFGSAAGRDQRAYELNRYLRGRGQERKSENPVSLAENQPYLEYSKSQLVFYTLGRFLGEEKMNAILRRLLITDIESPIRTTRDLMDWLQTESTPEQRQLIDDWLGKIVFYDLRIENVSSEQDSAGGVEIAFDVLATKTEASGDGEEQEVLMAELLEIGLYARHPDAWQATQEPIYLQEHLIQGPRTRVSLRVDQMPNYLVIDPNILRIDKNRFDNVVAIGK